MSDTCQTPSRQFPSTLQTTTRQSAKFRHVGSFLLIKDRWGLFFFFFLPWKNKVNSYSKQRKLSLVCKLELKVKRYSLWPLTKGFTNKFQFFDSAKPCLISQEPRKGALHFLSLEYWYWYHYFEYKTIYVQLLQAAIFLNSYLNTYP